MKRSVREYPNNLLADLGFGKIEGNFSEGFKSMLDDLLYSADSREDKRNYEFLLSYYEQHKTLSEIAVRYYSHISTVSDSKDRMIKIFRNTPLNKQVHDILDDELKMNENVFVAVETSLNDISKFRYDSTGFRVYRVLKDNGFHTIGDILQAGSAEIQSVLKHDGLAFAWLAELIISYCNQNPMDWKYHAPERNIFSDTEITGLKLPEKTVAFLQKNDIMTVGDLLTAGNDSINRLLRSDSNGEEIFWNIRNALKYECSIDVTEWSYKNAHEETE